MVCKPHQRFAPVTEGGFTLLEVLVAVSIFGLIAKALRQFDEIDKLPYSLLVQYISHYEGRPRRKRD